MKLRQQLDYYFLSSKFEVVLFSTIVNIKYGPWVHNSFVTGAQILSSICVIYLSHIIDIFAIIVAVQRGCLVTLVIAWDWILLLTDYHKVQSLWAGVRK